jgi:hypothetical protein
MESDWWFIFSQNSKVSDNNYSLPNMFNLITKEPQNQNDTTCFTGKERYKQKFYAFKLRGQYGNLDTLANETG